jgi:predicted Zn-dependent protease
MEADEHERLMRDSNLLIRDAGLNDYVRGVLCRTVGEERCRNVRIYVLRVPAFNATMAPNGMMILWSGLLLRCRSEAELASVLGHEFAHFERRHSLVGFQARRRATDVMAWTAVLGAIAQVPLMTDILVAGAYFQFNRNQEREADVLSLAYLSRSTYRPQVASEVWVNVMGEADASALGRSQPSRRYDRLPFTSTHPTSLERASYLRTLAGPDAPGRNDNADAYLTALRPWLNQFLEDQIRRNDFGGTEYLLAQLAQSGWTADLLYARGELYRMRGNPRDLVNAADFYRQSIALDASRPEAFRGLGLALLRAQAATEGREALVRYLSLKPDASDAPMIRMLAGQGS